MRLWWSYNLTSNFRISPWMLAGQLPSQATHTHTHTQDTLLANLVRQNPAVEIHEPHGNRIIRTIRASAPATLKNTFRRLNLSRYTHSPICCYIPGISALKQLNMTHLIDPDGGSLCCFCLLCFFFASSSRSAEQLHTASDGRNTFNDVTRSSTR